MGPAELLEMYRQSLSPLQTLGAGQLQIAQQMEGRRYQEAQRSRAVATARDQAIFEAGLQRGLEETKAKARAEADQETTRVAFGLREDADNAKRDASRKEGEDNAAALLRMQDQYEALSNELEAAMQLSPKQQEALAKIEDPELQMLALEQYRKAKALDPKVTRLSKQLDRMGRNMDLLQRSTELYFGPEFRAELERRSAAPVGGNDREMSAEEIVDALAAKFGKGQAATAPARSGVSTLDESLEQFGARRPAVDPTYLRGPGPNVFGPMADRLKSMYYQLTLGRDPNAAAAVPSATPGAAVSTLDEALEQFAVPGAMAQPVQPTDQTQEALRTQAQALLLQRAEALRAQQTAAFGVAPPAFSLAR